MVVVVVVVTGGAAWKKHSQGKSQVRAFTTNAKGSANAEMNKNYLAAKILKMKVGEFLFRKLF